MGFLGSCGRGKCPPLLSCYSGLEGPSRLPLLNSPRPPSYAPRTNVCVGGTLEGRRLAWELSRLPRPEWVGQMPSASLPLLPDGSSLLPLLISLASLLSLQGPTSPGGGFGGQGTSLGAQQAPWARVGGANFLRFSPAPPRGPLLPSSPDLPGLRGADPVWPPLLLRPVSPRVLPVHLGVPTVSLGVRVPHQQLTGALVVGRR